MNGVVSRKGNGLGGGCNRFVEAAPPFFEDRIAEIEDVFSAHIIPLILWCPAVSSWTSRSTIELTCKWFFNLLWSSIDLLDEGEVSLSRAMKLAM